MNWVCGYSMRGLASDRVTAYKLSKVCKRLFS